VTLACGLPGTDRISPLTSSSRSRLPVLLAHSKRAAGRPMMPVDLAGLGMAFAVLAALAVLVKYERRLSRWLVKSPRRRRRKAARLKAALL
jgi:hypothetical protein